MLSSLEKESDEGSLASSKTEPPPEVMKGNSPSIVGSMCTPFAPLAGRLANCAAAANWSKDQFVASSLGASRPRLRIRSKRTRRLL